MSENGLHKIPAMRAALEAIQEQHEPAEALMNPGRREQLVKVCTGCGTDDGNWQLWPCRTRRLADQGLGGGQDG